MIKLTFVYARSDHVINSRPPQTLITYKCLPLQHKRCLPRDTRNRILNDTCIDVKVETVKGTVSFWSEMIIAPKPEPRRHLFSSLRRTAGSAMSNTVKTPVSIVIVFLDANVVHVADLSLQRNSYDIRKAAWLNAASSDQRTLTAQSSFHWDFIETKLLNHR